MGFLCPAPTFTLVIKKKSPYGRHSLSPDRVPSCRGEACLVHGRFSAAETPNDLFLVVVITILRMGGLHGRPFWGSPVRVPSRRDSALLRPVLQTTAGRQSCCIPNYHQFSGTSGCPYWESGFGAFKFDLGVVPALQQERISTPSA